jgi:hypothetical protein
VVTVSNLHPTVVCETALVASGAIPVLSRGLATGSDDVACQCASALFILTAGAGTVASQYCRAIVAACVVLCGR